MDCTQRNFYKFSKLTFISCAISVAVGGILSLFLFIKTSNFDPTKAENLPFVRFHNLNEANQDLNLILKEQSLIYDSEPIFIPSRWNESQDPFKNTISDPLFGEFPPVTTLYDQSKLSSIIKERSSISSPKDILNERFINFFSGINQNEPDIFSLKKRSAHVTIQNLENFDIEEEYEIIGDSDLQINDQFWAPIEFLLIVDESGPVIPLLLTESSGREHIDNFFKNSVSQPLLKLGSLPVGYYKISVTH